MTESLEADKFERDQRENEKDQEITKTLSELNLLGTTLQSSEEQSESPGVSTKDLAKKLDDPAQQLELKTVKKTVPIYEKKFFKMPAVKALIYSRNTPPAFAS